MLDQDRPLPAPTVAAALIDVLVAENVTKVFGVPGGNIAPFIQELRRRTDIEFVIAAHEGGAAFMADGYARASGRLGVCLVTAGPGATNALTGVAAAHLDGVPLLVVSGQVRLAQFGLGAIQESTPDKGVDTCAMFGVATAYSSLVVSEEAFPRQFARALAVAYSGNAAHLCVPLDVSRRACTSAVIRPRVDALGAAPDARALGEAAELLRASTRPLLVLGAGSSRWALRDGAAVAWAERMGVPVATTLRAKGVFPEDHPLSLGVLGMGGDDRPPEYLRSGCDLVIIAGSALGEWATRSFAPIGGTDRRVIRVDRDPAALVGYLPADVAMLGDAGASLDELARIGTPSDPPGRLPPHEPRPTARSAAGGVHPAELMAALQGVVSPTTDLYVDMGNCTAWSSRELRIAPPARVFYPCGLSTMGWSIGAVVGGALADGLRVSVALCGDGALLMNGSELLTASRTGARCVFVVLHDGYLGMVNHGEHTQAPQFGLDDPAYALGDVDLVKYVEAMGVRAHPVASGREAEAAVARAVRAAQTDHAPQAVVVMIDPSIPPPYGERFGAVASSGPSPRTTASAR